MNYRRKRYSMDFLLLLLFSWDLDLFSMDNNMAIRNCNWLWHFHFRTAVTIQQSNFIALTFLESPDPPPPPPPSILSWCIVCLKGINVTETSFMGILQRKHVEEKDRNTTILFLVSSEICATGHHKTAIKQSIGKWLLEGRPVHSVGLLVGNGFIFHHFLTCHYCIVCFHPSLLPLPFPFSLWTLLPRRVLPLLIL